VDAAVQLAMDGPLFGFIDLPDRIRIHRDRQMLIITREKNNLRLAGAPDLKSKFPDYEYEISKPGKLHIKEAGCHLELTGMGIEEIPDLRCTGQKVAFFDIDMLAFPLTVRNFRPGDRFSSLGMAGSQKLQKFFSNNKFSRAERMRCPLLVSQDQIIWVAGHRPGDSAKIKPETRRVLKAQLLLA
jgi:tRNA(Ile)-lysidine synthase